MQVQHTLEPNRQNTHVIAQIATAGACTEKLAARGFTVLAVAVEGRRPVVWVQYSSHCEALDSGMVLRRPGPRGCEQVMAADIDGCQVQWLLVGN